MFAVESVQETAVMSSKYAANLALTKEVSGDDGPPVHSVITLVLNV